MRVIVIGLGTLCSAGEKFGCTWEHRGAPEASLGARRITVEQNEKNNIFFENPAGAPGNISYCLSFNNF